MTVFDQRTAFLVRQRSPRNRANHEIAAASVLLIIRAPVSKRRCHDHTATCGTRCLQLSARAKPLCPFAAKLADLGCKLLRQVLIANLYRLPPDKVLKLCAVILHINRSVCDAVQPLFPRSRHLGIQQRWNCHRDDLIHHLAKILRRDHLRFLIEVQITNPNQLFDNLCPRRACPDARTFDLRAKLLVLNKLTCIFHRKNH